MRKGNKRDKFNTKVYYTSEDIIYIPVLRETQIEEQKDTYTEAKTNIQTDSANNLTHFKTF